MSFAYHRAESLAEALAVLAEHPGRVTPLAGGQSLLPDLRAGRTRAEVLLDIGRVPELSFVEDRGDHIAIGAATRHHELAASGLLAARLPALRAAAAAIGDPQVRHMGTIGGSLAYADPAADLAVAALALDARVVLDGPGGRRVLPFEGFARARGSTVIAPGELLVEVRVPAPAVPAAWSYRKFSRDALEWAVVAVLAVAGETTRVALSGMGPTVVRAGETEAALARGDGAEASAALADAGTAPPDDVRASGGYRRHLARVLTRRALEEIGVETAGRGVAP